MLLFHLVLSIDMASDIDELLKRISINEDDEDDIFVGKDWVEEGNNAGRNCLIAKMVIERLKRNKQTHKILVFGLLIFNRNHNKRNLSFFTT